jgi:aryl sulfotransferase
MQMICALLVFQRPDLPAPLAELSPWLDWRGAPIDDVVAMLQSQQHRRVIKTHTPLDGIPLEPQVSYVAVARHPLDSAVSLYHQAGNLDRARMAELTGRPMTVRPHRPPVAEWLTSWIGSTADPRRELDSLPGVMLHLSDAWQRRNDDNVELVHYNDLIRDLDGQMRTLASRLGFTVPAERWPNLVTAATFESMRADAGRVVPDPAGILQDQAAFFRSGRSGGGISLLNPEELAEYDLAPPDLLEWLHR